MINPCLLLLALGVKMRHGRRVSRNANNLHASSTLIPSQNVPLSLDVNYVFTTLGPELKSFYFRQELNCVHASLTCEETTSSLRWQLWTCLRRKQNQSEHTSFPWKPLFPVSPSLPISPLKATRKLSGSSHWNNCQVPLQRRQYLERKCHVMNQRKNKTKWSTTAEGHSNSTRRLLSLWLLP